MRKYKDSIIVHLALGDDCLFLSRNIVDVTTYGNLMKYHYNMVNKMKCNDKVGEFLRFIIYLDKNKTLHLIPNYIRLYNKHMLLNGYPNNLQLVLHVRNLSYLYTLGNISPSRYVLEKMDYDFVLPSYYDENIALEANAIFNNIGLKQVENIVWKMAYNMINCESYNVVKFYSWLNKIQ
jgi:hypothetical protein